MSNSRRKIAAPYILLIRFGEGKLKLLDNEQVHGKVLMPAGRKLNKVI